MAELVLSATFQVIFEKLASFGLDKSEGILEFRANMEKMQGILSRVQAALDDVEEKQVIDRSAIRTVWLSNLKDLVHDTEALLLGLPH
ncbi:hypothetical protein TorRG33x02_104030 [Trema orientale]|uniref:Disease resistance N-terminal domain-containing protein n=1 Tax=Trema orientale TaxID=63057 RepID=A0A2P5F7C3_TREOI|nr:hypothetical protein TorRG33x02_104030 [Trema orientale]